MPIKKFTVSNDETIYEAWPDLIKTESGKLICVFTECNSHKDRNNSRIVIRESNDRGRTWGEKKPVTEKTTATAFFNNARLSLLNDGRLAVICDRVSGGEDCSSEIYVWFADNEGMSWSDPVIFPFCGIVPDKLLHLKNGRMIIAAHFKNSTTQKLEQYLWYSEDKGESWSDRVTLAADSRYNLCEVSILELPDETLVAFMRENSSTGINCLKSISYDHGGTWQGVYDMPIPACHRPVAGLLNDGSVMITHRYMQGGAGWLGFWTQNIFAAFTDIESVKATERNQQKVRIMPLDYDRSPKSDLGYTGWVQFEDGEIYVVNYIMDDADKAQIRGYSFTMDDVITQSEGQV